MPRSTKEWIGKRPDSMPPPRVRQRIFDRAGGVCHWCKIAIKVPAETWQADHVVAVINGGENRESNLAPIHGHCHVEKTGLDVAEKAKTAAIRKKHIGATRPVAKIAGRPFPRSERSARRKEKTSLPPRKIYRPVDLLRRGELARAGNEGD